jgi:hypothetical protein
MNSLAKSMFSTYCAYYKPAKDEELACRGYTVIQELIGKRIRIPLPEGGDSGRKKAGMPGADAELLLIESICQQCPFNENDCDFISYKRLSIPVPGNNRVEPCGGFIFLGQLLDGAVIKASDLSEL